MLIFFFKEYVWAYITNSLKQVTIEMGLTHLKNRVTTKSSNTFTKIKKKKTSIIQKKIIKSQ